MGVDWEGGIGIEDGGARGNMTEGLRNSVDHEMFVVIVGLELTTPSALRILPCWARSCRRVFCLASAVLSPPTLWRRRVALRTFPMVW